MKLTIEILKNNIKTLAQYNEIPDEVVDYTIEHCDDDTKKLVLTRLAKTSESSKYLKYIIKYCDNDIIELAVSKAKEISDEAVYYAIEHWSWCITKLVFTRLAKTSESSEYLKHIIERCDSDIVKIAVSKAKEIPEDAVATALGKHPNYGITKSVLTRLTEISESSKYLNDIIKYCDDDTIKLAVSKIKELSDDGVYYAIKYCDDDIKESLLTRLAKTSESSEYLKHIIERCDSDIVKIAVSKAKEIPEDAVATALGKHPNYGITKSVLTRLTETSESSEYLKYIIKYGDTCTIEAVYYAIEHWSWCITKLVFTRLAKTSESSKYLKHIIKYGDTCTIELAVSKVKELSDDFIDYAIDNYEFYVKKLVLTRLAKTSESSKYLKYIIKYCDNDIIELAVSKAKEISEEAVAYALINQDCAALASRTSDDNKKLILTKFVETSESSKYLDDIIKYCDDDTIKLAVSKAKEISNYNAIRLSRDYGINLKDVCVYKEIYKELLKESLKNYNAENWHKLKYYCDLIIEDKEPSTTKEIKEIIETINLTIRENDEINH